MTKIKGIKYLGKKNGKDQFEECEVDIPSEQEFDYNQLVTDFIREKYSMNEEFSLNAKSMQMYSGNCTEEQRAKWLPEIKKFTNYREECISKARIICKKQ